MSWLKSIAALCFVGLVSACGFTPIAAERDGDPNSTALSVRSITVESTNDRFNYSARREVLKHVRIDPAARYALKVETKIERTNLAITADDKITRYNLEAISSYRLIGIADDPEIARDTRSIASVNATTDVFAAQASERAAIVKLAKRTGQKITLTLRLIDFERASKQAMNIAE